MKTLIVEDSELIRTDLVEMLTKYETLFLFQAANGQDALKIFEKENPDLVILDLGLPYLSGFEVLRKIKNKKSVVTVIVLTNHSEKYFVEICQKYGADYFYDKSTQLDEFLLTVKNLTQRKNLTEQ